MSVDRSDAPWHAVRRINNYPVVLPSDGVLAKSEGTITLDVYQEREGR